MLRASYDLLKPGGRIAFMTIYIAPGVNVRDYRRAQRARGSGIAEKRALSHLCRAAGFVDVVERDATPAFAESSRAYLETSARYNDELREAWGSEKFAEAQRDRKATLSLIGDGVLRRSLFTARRPTA